jgi:hypothetical protein
MALWDVMPSSFVGRKVTAVIGKGIAVVFVCVVDLMVPVAEDCMAMITWMIMNAGMGCTLTVVALT